MKKSNAIEKKNIPYSEKKAQRGSLGSHGYDFKKETLCLAADSYPFTKPLHRVTFTVLVMKFVSLYLIGMFFFVLKSTFFFFIFLSYFVFHLFC